MINIDKKNIIKKEFVTVEFLYKIRAEKKFDSLELLIQQIKEDIAKAKQYFRIMQ